MNLPYPMTDESRENYLDLVAALLSDEDDDALAVYCKAAIEIGAVNDPIILARLYQPLTRELKAREKDD